MSFEVNVQCFQKGECAEIPLQRVRDVFSPHLTEIDSQNWRIRFDDANFCDLYLRAHATDPELALGFTIHRPCADHRLWDALASILALGNVAIYFPGGRAPLVASRDVTEHLPQDMIVALGEPVVVTSGEEILNEIQVG